jgi:hypothetical protein
MTRLSERVARLEAAHASSRHQIVRRHIINEEPDKRGAVMGAIEAAEPSAFHIFRVIVKPANAGASP